MKFSEDEHYRVLRALEQNPYASQRVLARELGISLGAVNYCLKALIERGHVKMRNFRASKQKYRYAYILTPRGIAAKTRLAIDFLNRRLAEYDALQREIDEAQETVVVASQDPSTPAPTSQATSLDLSENKT